jgi:A/G-specific adenine glycosylase
MSVLNKMINPLLKWYEGERRVLLWREDPTPYHVWISEIMLQQTRVEAVIDYYHRFLTRFPDIETLAKADLDEVLSYWQGLGYYRRCEMLYRMAHIIVNQYQGKIPSDYETLLSLPGIGRYTAAAIMSIGFEKPYAAVDGNVLRVIMRLKNSDECIDDEKVKRRVESELQSVMPVDRTSEFTQSLMDLGAMICLPNGTPKCGVCPLSTICRGKENADRIPVRKEKKRRRLEKKTVFLFVYQDKIAIKKRSASGLLAKMWEFPNENGILSPEEVKKRYDDNIYALGKAKHVFTHIEWEMIGYRVEFAEKPIDDTLLWIKKEEIASYAIPSAFSYFKKDL